MAHRSREGKPIIATWFSLHLAAVLACQKQATKTLFPFIAHWVARKDTNQRHPASFPIHSGRGRDVSCGLRFEQLRNVRVVSVHKTLSSGKIHVSPSPPQKFEFPCCAGREMRCPQGNRQLQTEGGTQAEPLFNGSLRSAAFSVRLNRPFLNLTLRNAAGFTEFGKKESYE